jgi:hypothetical protein
MREFEPAIFDRARARGRGVRAPADGRTLSAVATRVVHLRPGAPVRVGGYDLDAFAVECDDAGGLDFRLELGAGLGIYWALAAGRDNPLRLVHVDGAAYHLDEPELVAEPWAPDLPRLAWQGELFDLGGGRTLVGVSFEARSGPPSYRCELVERDAAGGRREHRFAWGDAAARPR